MAKHDYSSTQLNLPQGMAQMVRAWGLVIPDSELASKGRCDDPHITCKYGLMTQEWPDVQDAVSGFGGIHITLGDIGIFEANESSSGERFDVVHIRVLSPDLCCLNERLGRLPHVDTHANYSPHVTVAYVRPGCGIKYLGLPDLMGLQARFLTMEFSSKDGSKHEIELGMPGQKSLDVVFHKAGPPDEARDNHGRWTAGAGGVTGGDKTQKPADAPTSSLKMTDNHNENIENIHQSILEHHESVSDHATESYERIVSDFVDDDRIGADDIDNESREVASEIKEKFSSHISDVVNDFAEKLEESYEVSVPVEKITAIVESAAKDYGRGVDRLAEVPRRIRELEDAGNQSSADFARERLDDAGAELSENAERVADGVKDQLDELHSEITELSADDDDEIEDENKQEPAKMQMVHGRRDELSSKLEESRLGRSQPKPLGTMTEDEFIGTAKSGAKVFTTSGGSIYFHQNGRTQRVKAEIPSHPVGDSGLKKPSLKTVFIDPESAKLIGMNNTSSSKKIKILMDRGHIMQVSLSPDGSKFGADTKPIKFSDKPSIGMSPLELWESHEHDSGTAKYQAFSNNHPGHPIVEVSDPTSNHHKVFSAAHEKKYGKTSGHNGGIGKKTQDSIKDNLIRDASEKIKVLHENFKTHSHGAIKQTVEAYTGELGPEEMKNVYKQVFGHYPLSSSGKKIRDEISQRISERKESWDRIQFRSDGGTFINKSLLTSAGLALLAWMEKANFNPSQARGPDGRWVSGGDMGGSAKTSPDKKKKTPGPKTKESPKTNPEAKIAPSKEKPGAAPQPKQSPEAPKMQQVHARREELSKKLESSRLNPDKVSGGESSVDRAVKLLEDAKTAHVEKGSVKDQESALKKQIKDEAAKHRRGGTLSKEVQGKLDAKLNDGLKQIQEQRQALAQQHAKAIDDYAAHLKQMNPEELKEFTKQTGLRGKNAETLAKEAYIAAQDRSRWQQEVRKNGISVAHFKAASKEIRDAHNETVDHYNALIDDAAGEGFLAKVRAVHSRGGDHAGIPGFDELAERMAISHPEYFGGGFHSSDKMGGDRVYVGHNFEEKLFDYLVAGKQKQMSKEESFQMAFDKLKDMKDRGEYRRVKQRSGGWVPWEDF